MLGTMNDNPYLWYDNERRYDNPFFKCCFINIKFYASNRLMACRFLGSLAQECFFIKTNGGV
jgi:hypothetical protein